MKTALKAGTLLYPLPAVIVTCGAMDIDFNMITISWTGTVCTNPPMCYISVRPERHSYPIIKKYGEFVINLTTKDMARNTDWCGVRSGKDFNKFAETKFTPIPAQKVKAPLIAESPINIECVVNQIITLGSHDMFIADVVAVNASDELIDSQTGTLDLAKAKPICYSHGFYYVLGDCIGKFGFSVQKKKRK